MELKILYLRKVQYSVISSTNFRFNSIMECPNKISHIFIYVFFMFFTSLLLSVYNELIAVRYLTGKEHIYNIIFTITASFNKCLHR